MLIENTSIIIIPFLVLFLHDHKRVFNFGFTNDAPDFKLLLELAAIQLVIEVVADYISVVLEYLQRIPVWKVFEGNQVKVMAWQLIKCV